MRVLFSIILIIQLSCSISAQDNTCVNHILLGKNEATLGKCKDYLSRYNAIISHKSSDSLSVNQKFIISETENWAKRLCKFNAETPIGYYDAEKRLVPDSVFQDEVE